MNGVTALAQTTRDLACVTRLLVPLLETLGEWGGSTSIGELVSKTGAEERDVRMALFVLEENGLAKSRTFGITEEGRCALKT